MNQVCFIDDKGYMICNAVYRHGILVFSKSGKWFRFLANKKTKR